MADVVIFDENATPQRVLSVRRSVNTPDYLGRTDIVVNPDLSALEGLVPRRYWKHDAGAIVEYTQGEKDAQDAAEAASELTRRRTNAKDLLAGTGDIQTILKAMTQELMIEINALNTLASRPTVSLGALRTRVEDRIDAGQAD